MKIFSTFSHRLYLYFMCIVASVIVLPPALARAQQKSPQEINREVDAMLSKLTLKQKIDLISGTSTGTYPIPSIGLPSLRMSDGPMGVKSWGPTIGYAAGIGLAASWDTRLAGRVGVALGHDARARGVNFLLGPGVNIYRAPMDGRNFEFFGEDPYLAGQIAVHYIRGVQSQDVVATIKHYDANNSEYDRHDINTIVDERTLHEIYLPVFEAAVKQGHVGAVMDSYNLINGEHATQNKYLDTDVLKKEWGFQGILMSDWGATYNGVAAANAGLDLEMPSGQFMNAKTLLPAIKDGKVSVATINDKVRRILRVALEFGFFKNDQTELNIPKYSQQSRKVALESAQEAMVLLKNDGNLLPLNLRNIHTIALIGPDAYPAEASAGGSAHVTPFAAVSFLTGLSNTFGTRTKVLWSRGVRDINHIFAESSFVTNEQGTQPGLRQEEFSNASFQGEPLRVSTVPSLNSWANAEWEPTSYPHAYRWTGYYIPKKSGVQRFIAATWVHDSYRLYVNGKLVLQAGPNMGVCPKAVDINLPAGKPVAVRFDYVPGSKIINASLGALPAQDMLEPGVRKMATMADVVIASVGFNQHTESEGFDRTYHLPPGQEQLIKTLVAANPRTIVVLTAGGSVATSGWLDRVPVFLQTWYGGSEAGLALAEVLTGDVDPSGKLPITWWRRVQDNPAYPNYYEAPGTHTVKYREGIFLGYRAYGRPGQPAPLFPFGYGLSYTTFTFNHLSVTPEAASPAGPIRVSFDVQNTGQRTGSEVAQVYVGDPSATVPRPKEELKGFERVTLSPGQTKHVTIRLNRSSLAYWDVNSHGWKVDPGTFVVYVGDSSENLPLQEKFTVR